MNDIDPHKLDEELAALLRVTGSILWEQIKPKQGVLIITVAIPDKYPYVAQFGFETIEDGREFLLRYVIDCEALRVRDIVEGEQA